MIQQAKPEVLVVARCQWCGQGWAHLDRKPDGTCSKCGHDFTESKPLDADDPRAPRSEAEALRQRFERGQRSRYGRCPNCESTEIGHFAWDRDKCLQCGCLMTLDAGTGRWLPRLSEASAKAYRDKGLTPPGEDS